MLNIATCCWEFCTSLLCASNGLNQRHSLPLNHAHCGTCPSRNSEIQNVLGWQGNTKKGFYFLKARKEICVFLLLASSPPVPRGHPRPTHTCCPWQVRNEDDNVWAPTCTGPAWDWPGLWVEVLQVNLKLKGSICFWGTTVKSSSHSDRQSLAFPVFFPLVDDL